MKGWLAGFAQVTVMICNPQHSGTFRVTLLLHGMGQGIKRALDSVSHRISISHPHTPIHPVLSTVSPSSYTKVHAVSTPAHCGMQQVLCLFALTTVMADGPSFFPLPPTPTDHMLRAMIIWLLMQVCNDRDHNQWDFDYCLLKMRQRLLFTASPCHHQSHDFLSLPVVLYNLPFPGTALPITGIVLPSAGVNSSVAGKQSIMITYAAYLLLSGMRLARRPLGPSLAGCPPQCRRTNDAIAAPTSGISWFSLILTSH